jgi:hypothetical protein
MTAAAQPQRPLSEAERRNALYLRAQIVERKKQKTPLETRLGADRLIWLAQYATNRWRALYSSLGSWRSKLEIFQQQAEDAFAWRRSVANRNSGESIFQVQNDSLNMIGAFAEFFTAQAENDILGSEPWFIAKPIGKSDKNLGEQISAHAQWKFRQTNLESAYKEAIGIAADLGTCFTKKTWETHIDRFDTVKKVLTLNKKPVLTSAGEHILSTDKIVDEELDGIPPKVPGQPRRYAEKDPTVDLDAVDAYEYNDFRADQEKVTFAGNRAYNLDFRDVAFDPTAPELDLNKTDFFHKFRKRLYDVCIEYKLDDMAKFRLYQAVGVDKNEASGDNPMQWRDEDKPDEGNIQHPDSKGIDNTPITLVEGYMRVDPTGTGHRLGNIYCVFAPELDLIIKCDYLQNVTPEGMLPIHAHVINRVRNRIVGRGFFEKFELVQTFIDDLFNRICYRERKHSNPLTALDKTKLKLEDEEEPDFEKPLNLKADQKLDDAVQFKTYPDLSDKGVQMLQLMVQMVQMRTGITAAQQGDLAGLPENNTATGIRQLMSRAAVLLKSPIMHLKRGFEKDVDYNVVLLYSNFDREEAFVFGEGENEELVTLTPEMVIGIRFHITLTMSQAQNQAKIETCERATQLHLQYTQLPELEKQSGRSLYVQAIKALEFVDAEIIIRQAIITLEDAITVLPDEQKAIAQQVVTAGVASIMQQQAAAPAANVTPITSTPPTAEPAPVAGAA